MESTIQYMQLFTITRVKYSRKRHFIKTLPATSSKNTFMLWSPYGLILVSVILFTAMNFYIELSMQSCTQNSAALLLTKISMTLWIFHVICTAFPHI